MRFEELKRIVGTSNVITNSNWRYSELRSFVEKAQAWRMAHCPLSIVVQSGTLNYAEIESLSKLGGKYVTFYFTEQR